jgi:hypothetical protein
MLMPVMTPLIPLEEFIFHAKNMKVINALDGKN